MLEKVNYSFSHFENGYDVIYLYTSCQHFSCLWFTQHHKIHKWWQVYSPGRALNFFQVGMCGPDFWSVGLANWYLPLKRGVCELKISKFRGLWAENFKFGGLWAKISVKIEAVEAKITKFSQKGVLWTDSFAWNGTLANYRRGVKRGSSGPHIPIPPF